jgi:hypothetical protein
MTDPLSKTEAAEARARASAGEMPSLDLLRRFVATIRQSWLAKPDAQTKGKSREKKPSPDDKQIDFF